MIRFEDDRYIIEVITGVRPSESWINAVSQLVDVLNTDDAKGLNDTTEVFNLLSSMIPDKKQASKMEEKS